MVVVIGRCIEAIPKKARVECIGQIEACFGGVSNYCTFKPLVVGIYAFYYMHYFKTQVLNLTSNALFQLR